MNNRQNAYEKKIKEDVQNVPHSVFAVYEVSFENSLLLFLMFQVGLIESLL